MLAASSVSTDACSCFSRILMPFTFCLIGEDALANLSIEKTEAGSITGHVRIRSKTQGIALSLGDRITMGEIFVVLFGYCSRSNISRSKQHKKIILNRRY